MKYINFNLNGFEKNYSNGIFKSTQTILISKLYSLQGSPISFTVKNLTHVHKMTYQRTKMYCGSLANNRNSNLYRYYCRVA